jgi:hypothetical protein
MQPNRSVRSKGHAILGGATRAYDPLLKPL